MTRRSMEHIPLAGAYLCTDCNSVGNCAMKCPACASTVLLGLAGVLNREEQETKAAWPWMGAAAIGAADMDAVAA